MLRQDLAVTYLYISGEEGPLQLDSSDGVHLVCLAQVFRSHLTEANVLDLALIDKCLYMRHYCILVKNLVIVDKHLCRVDTTAIWPMHLLSHSQVPHNREH